MKLADRTHPTAWKPCKTPPHSALSVGRRPQSDAFGHITGETDATVDHIFGFTGRERDEESDLNYYRARYYDPSTGQFIGQDPVGFDAGDANLYRYVGNGPTNATDPSGLQPPDSVVDRRHRIIMEEIRRENARRAAQAAARPARVQRWNAARTKLIGFAKTTDCKGTNPDLTLTFYIRQPESGNRTRYEGFGWTFGHATVEVSDGVRSNMRGFWPGPGQTMASLDRDPVQGGVKTDRQEREELKKKGYHVKFTVKILNPNVTFDEVVAFMDNYQKRNKYDLDDKSCGHFVLDVARFVGAPIPAAFGTLKATRNGKSKIIIAPSAMGEDFMLIGGCRHQAAFGFGK